MISESIAVSPISCQTIHNKISHVYRQNSKNWQWLDFGVMFLSKRISLKMLCRFGVCKTCAVMPKLNKEMSKNNEQNESSANKVSNRRSLVPDVKQIEANYRRAVVNRNRRHIFCAKFVIIEMNSELDFWGLFAFICLLRSALLYCLCLRFHCSRRRVSVYMQTRACAIFLCRNKSRLLCSIVFASSVLSILLHWSHIYEFRLFRRLVFKNNVFMLVYFWRNQQKKQNHNKKRHTPIELYKIKRYSVRECFSAWPIKRAIDSASCLVNVSVVLPNFIICLFFLFGQ